MNNSLNIAVAQIAPVVGDVCGNVKKILAARQKAATMGAELVVYCELVIAGYPPEDLVQKPSFQRACRDAVATLATETADGGPGIIVGAPWRENEALYNTAFLIDGGAIQNIVHKVRLPNYGVFDEPRRFVPGDGFPKPTDFRGTPLGLMICEDMWLPGCGEYLADKGAEIFIVPHGSPYRKTALAERLIAATDRVKATSLPLIFVNQLAGQDEIIFDGASFVLDREGKLVSRMPQFEGDVYLTRWSRGKNGWELDDGPDTEWSENEEQVYRAVTLAVRDYVQKNNFRGVIIGLSGGVDSALTAAIAVDALGADSVKCVMMPSRYTSEDSLRDARQCARMLGVEYSSIDIEPGVLAFDEMLAEAFDGTNKDTTEENIQSRLRGMVLMALSNKFGDMVLTTGNKSEMSVGYATLYGDMNGGFNPLKDMYKSEVFRLCRWRNENSTHDLRGPKRMVIPENIIAKPPSAELREDQKDADSLPPYDVLDPILEGLVEKEMSVRDLVATGFDEKTVRRIEHLLYVAEYKRRQAPPGPKITSVNFGRDRRYPITNGWRDQ